MAYKGKEKAGDPAVGAVPVQLWTFESRENLDRFAAILDEHGLAYEVQNKKGEAAKGPDGVVITVATADYAKGRRLLLRHRKRRTSSGRG
jgi:hypothetical protein